jgi:hypothetical protein
MRAAAAAVLACAAAQDVALCVTGQLRTFAHERVRRSQERFVAALRAEASTVDAFLVVSGAPSDGDRARLAAVYAPVSLDVAADVAGALDQYGMLATCGARMRRRGDYAWAVKSRFDVFWYGPFPPLATLPPHAIHSRMRCWVFEGAFSADAASRAAIADRPPVRGRRLSRGRVDVDAADVWTNRWLSSSARRTAAALASKRSTTRALKSGRRFEVRAGGVRGDAVEARAVLCRFQIFNPSSMCV